MISPSTVLARLTPNLVGSIVMTCRSKKTKIVWIKNQNLENLFCTSPEPKGQLTENLVRSIEDFKIKTSLNRSNWKIQDGHHSSHFKAYSPEPKRQPTQNAVVSFGETFR